MLVKVYEGEIILGFKLRQVVSFALECNILKGQVNKEWLEFNDTYQCLIYGTAVNLLGKNTTVIKNSH